MKKQFFLFFFMLACRICMAQNIVLNGDFEQYNTCPFAYDLGTFATSWINPTLGGTPDYLNQCASAGSLVSVPVNFDCNSYQQAHSGNGYVTIINYSANAYDYREYMEATLSPPLTAGTCYSFQMYISLVNCSRYVTDGLGIYFSNTLVSDISTDQLLPYVPQIANPAFNYFTDTTNWIKFSGTYTAQGGERYLIIGNFIDDLYLNTMSINSGAYYNNNFIYIDDVSLVPCSSTNAPGLQNETTAVELSHNSVTNKLNITTNSLEPLLITLYDISSRKLLQQTFINAITIDTGQLTAGIYLYEVKNKSGLMKKGKVVKE
jgi:hypothetical protein